MYKTTIEFHRFKWVLLLVFATLIYYILTTFLSTSCYHLICTSKFILLFCCIVLFNTSSQYLFVLIEVVFKFLILCHAFSSLVVILNSLEKQKQKNNWYSAVCIVDIRGWICSNTLLWSTLVFIFFMAEYSSIESNDIRLMMVHY